jgi:hypothetical protein
MARSVGSVWGGFSEAALVFMGALSAILVISQA